MKKELFAKKTLALAMAALMAAGALTGCSSGSKETAAAGDTTAARLQVLGRLAQRRPAQRRSAVPGRRLPLGSATGRTTPIILH